MKLSLKSNLIISYVFLSLFLVFSLLVILNHMFEKNFQTYIQKIQEQKNMGIVTSVLNEFEKNGEPSMTFLDTLGHNSLNEGVILMVNDKFGNELFCMSKSESVQSENMLEAMKETMSKRYSHWQGEYTEVIYGLTKNGVNYGKVTLGFLGPFYYNDYDAHFIDMLNRILATVAIVFLFVAIGIGFYMASRMSKPIKKIIDKTEEIEHGHFSDRIDIVTHTHEIDRLITSVNNLANTLENEQKIKKRMARDYAHEFRTPLATLQSNFEGMIDGIFESTPERLESCRSEVIRLSRMVADIDKITTMENSSLVLVKEKFDLKALIEQIILNFENDLAGKNIKLGIHAQRCEINADKDKISQVIINLVSNAVKYTNNNGKIEIFVKGYTDVVAISVLDNGIGISPDDLPNIFEYLYRTDKSRTRDTGGSGIGLSVVKSIINAHGGTIDVKSEVSKGSEFIVTLKKK